MKCFIRNILERFGYFKIEDLQVGGHCILCGKPLNGVFEKDWAFGLCENVRCLNTCNADKKEK